MAVSDQNLLAFGCGVAFMALGGIYIFVRERYLFGNVQQEKRAAVLPVTPAAKR